MAPVKQMLYTMLATLAGCEMGLKLAGVRLAASGTAAIMDHFAHSAEHKN